GQQLEGVTVQIESDHQVSLSDISRFYAGGRQEILNESCRNEVLANILGWNGVPAFSMHCSSEARSWLSAPSRAVCKSLTLWSQCPIFGNGTPSCWVSDWLGFNSVWCQTILIPQSLAVRGFVAHEIGPAIIWTALPLLFIAFIAGLLLANKADSRLLMASG